MPKSTSVVVGVHELEPLEVVVPLRQVSRRKIALPALLWFWSRFVEFEANATYCPVVLTEGPAVARVGTEAAHAEMEPQMPLLACVPS